MNLIPGGFGRKKRQESQMPQGIPPQLMAQFAGQMPPSGMMNPMQNMANPLGMFPNVLHLFGGPFSSIMPGAKRIAEEKQERAAEDV